MSRAIAICLWLGACGFSVPSQLTEPDARGVDAALDDAHPPVDVPDAPMIDAPTTFCYGSFETVCLAQPPSMAFTVNAMSVTTIDTDDPAMCAPLEAGSTTGACVLAYTTITIDGRLAAQGTRPLVVIATSSITVNSDGRLDVASRNAGRGAGARECAGTNPTGRGGGFGASLGGFGGLGGTNGGGTGGLPNPTQTLTSLVGGCRGSNGGATTSSNAGLGGHGGGGVLVISPLIIIDGILNASGAGGGGGIQSNSGGGGGGSGGVIVLDTPDLVVNALGRLVAQGGGGGEGSGESTQGDAGDHATVVGQVASGGSGNSTSGGDGGAGAVSIGGTNGNGGSGGGGGGGGGGPGLIQCTDPTPPDTTGRSFPAMSCT